MKICQNCGFQLRDDSMFCINCGAKLVEQPAQNAPVSAPAAPTPADKYEAKANELRRICDELTAAYVRGMSSMDATAAAQKAKCDVETTELKNKLEHECETSKALTAELESVKAAIVRFSTENASLKSALDAEKQRSELLAAKVSALESSASSAASEDAIDITVDPVSEPVVEEAPAAPGVCPNCGTACSPEMSFCNECGTKLK